MFKNKLLNGLVEAIILVFVLVLCINGLIYLGIFSSIPYLGPMIASLTTKDIILICVAVGIFYYVFKFLSNVAKTVCSFLFIIFFIVWSKDNLPEFYNFFETIKNWLLSYI